MEPVFGEILARLRRAKGLSQRALAKELLISQALLCQYENGTREPGLPFLGRVCDFFGVSADYLLGRSDHKSQQVSVPALSRFTQELTACDDPDLTRIAEDYISAAAKRVCARLDGEELAAAEQAEEMARQELLLLRAIKTGQSNNSEGME